MGTRLRHAATLVGERELFDASPVGGGDLSDVWHLHFAHGRDVIVKIGGEAEKEAAMLYAMEQSGGRVPSVLAAQEDLLVLRYLQVGGDRAQSWVALGRMLSVMHKAPQSEHYGWNQSYAFGTMPIPNGWTRDWCLFWRDYRLKPCLDYLPRDMAARVADIADHLDRYLPRNPRPALLHGDLWSGNFLSIIEQDGEIGAALIDPACVIGDASADFAMLTLFSDPPEGFWRAYGLLPEGYERAIAVYQLWPAIVHFHLFGASYRAMLERVLDAVTL